MDNRLTVWLAVILLAMPLLASADGDRYQVEILVLQRKNVDIHTPNSYQLNKYFPPRADVIVLPPKPLEEDDIELPVASDDKPTAVPAERWQLSKQAERLTKNGDFSELLHIAWEQSAEPQKSTPMIEFDSRQFADDNEGTSTSGPYLIGHVKFTANRFIDLDAQLRLYDNHHKILQYIKQSRRMRRNQINYLDHPALAVMIKIVPIKPEVAPSPLPPTSPTMKSATSEPAAQ